MSAFVQSLPLMLRLAASFGCVGVLEELIDHRQCELAADACAAAAKNGQLDALTWLRSRGCPWNCSTCTNAASEGHLEVLRYAHEHGCPWDCQTCLFSAIGGHLELLRYALEHGCPVSLRDLEYCRARALAFGHAEVVEYLRGVQPNE